MGNIPFATPWPAPCRGFPTSCVIFISLGEAAKPIADADRHAKKELKKQVRGVRPLERALEGRIDEEAEAVRGYCLAVRSALTDELSRLQQLVQAGLTATQKLWPPVQQAYTWLHQAAHLLANAEQRDVTT